MGRKVCMKHQLGHIWKKIFGDWEKICHLVITHYTSKITRNLVYSIKLAQTILKITLINIRDCLIMGWINIVIIKGFKNER
jgi:hypothetical protein